jgi:type IX secretion system PorP/SprF family membrane protein
MRKSLFIISFIALLINVSLHGQDPSFTQFFLNKLYYNPAYSGLSRGLDISMSYRDLWPSIPGKFITGKFSGDIDISGIKGVGGIGINAISDIEGKGLLKTFSLGIPISVRPINFISSNKGHADHYFNWQVGFMVSVINKSINWNNFVFGDQIDREYGIIHSSSVIIPFETKKVFPDFSTGTVFEYQNAPEERHNEIDWTFQAGFACQHLTEPEFSFLGGDSRLPRTFIAHCISNIPMKFDHDLIVSPGLIYEKQADMQTIQFGSNLLWKMPFLGIWYRRYLKSDALAFVIGLKRGELNEGILYISYSYDYTISKLITSSSGAHEINLSFKFKSKPDHIIHCPAF